LTIDSPALSLVRAEKRGSLRMAVATTYVWISYLHVVFGAHGVDLDSTAEAQPAAHHACLNNHVRAGVGPQDIGHWTALAQVGCPTLRAWVAGYQAALLD
jgi:hypothetical protein